MKRFTFLLVTILSITANAQVLDTCEVWFNDTVRYIDAKTSNYSGISINQINDGGSYGYAGFAQMFQAPDTVTVKGVCFYGVMDTGGNATAAVKMYDGSGGTPGAMLAGTTHIVPYTGSGYTGAMNDAAILQCAIFSTPVEWEGDYFLGVENFTNTDMYIARNANGDGAAEALACTYYKGASDPTYDGWYNMYSFGTGWDFDAIIRPVVSYKGKSLITYDTTVCYGDTLNVDYQFVLEDSLMNNKFYNPDYATYTWATDSFGIDYGDLTTPTVDTFHLYTAPGNYNITFTIGATTGGWGTSNFLGECVVNTEVVDPSYDIADQTACTGDTVYFVAPPNYDSYLWDNLFNTDDTLMIETFFLSNGDYTHYVDMTYKGCATSDTMVLTIGELAVDLGGDTTVCLNQDITLTAGTFDTYNWNTGQFSESIQVGPFVGPGSEEIILNVTQGSCSGSDTLVVTIDNCLGVEENLSLDMEVYPNPTSGIVNISTNSEIEGVTLYNVLGAKIFDTKVINSNMIDLSKLIDGVYFMYVSTREGVAVKKIQIIR